MRKETNNKENNLEMMIVDIFLFILVIAAWILSLNWKFHITLILFELTGALVKNGHQSEMSLEIHFLAHFFVHY